MLFEEILSRENMQKAYQQVKRNKGCAGVDNVSVEELRKKLIDEWIFIRAEILEGKYNPQPVKRIEIPKPGGGKRELGIPVVLDRMIQQAIGQKLAELVRQRLFGNELWISGRKELPSGSEESARIHKSRIRTRRGSRLGKVL